MNEHEIADLLAGLRPQSASILERAADDVTLMMSPKPEGVFEKYRSDPVGYARDVLKVTPWSMQIDAMNLCASPQDDDWHGKLLIAAGVGSGKTALGGMLVNWYYDCFGPCIIATTAPSQSSVVDLLWKEVRLLRARADSKWGMDPREFMPSAPMLKRSTDWYAKGYVANSAETFKGRHVERMMFLFDESVRLPDIYFRATKDMFKTRTEMLWLAFCNPTDTTSKMYQEIIHPDSDWREMSLSSLEHPNVLAALKGEPLPIPAGVSLEQVESAIADDCESVAAEDKTAIDFEWPPGSNEWWHPGPAFQGNYLGVWPSGDESALWSAALWQAITHPLTWADVQIPIEEIPSIGCDVAYRGEGKTATHVGWGIYSVQHETKGLQEPMRTVGRLVELADEWAEKCTKARKGSDAPPIFGQHIPIKVDDIGIGGGVVSRLRELKYNVIPVAASEKAMNQKRYPNKRSELWFMTREQARHGLIKMGLLPTRILAELRKEAVAPLWSLNSAGQREIEPKERTAARLDGRSPDQMDSLNLQRYAPQYRTPELMNVEQQPFIERTREVSEERHRTPLTGRGNGRRGLFRR